MLSAISNQRRSPRIHLQFAGTLCALVFGLASFGHAQRGVSAAPGGSPQSSPSTVLSIAALEQGPRANDHTIVQLRRFFDGRGGVVTVREELRVDANGTGSPPHVLSFLGVEGELPASPLSQKWAQTYGRHSGLFYRHGCFHIHDLVKAQQNYTLHNFGVVVRAGRTAHRIVIFPNQIFPNGLDKAIWLLEVDTATFVPLYTAEYDPRFRLLSEIEAVTFSLTVQLGAPSPSLMVVTPQPSFVAAKAFMGDPDGVIEPSSTLVGEYGLQSVDVAINPLNNRQSLTLCYTDGVDEFFVVQSPGTSDFFAGLPTNKSATGNTNTIARYRDASMTVLLFWDDTVGFQVTGRGSLARLDNFAKSIYAQALSQ